MQHFFTKKFVGLCAKRKNHCQNRQIKPIVFYLTARRLHLFSRRAHKFWQENVKFGGAVQKPQL